jgi:hypothetical protein
MLYGVVAPGQSHDEFRRPPQQERRLRVVDKHDADEHVVDVRPLPAAAQAAPIDPRVAGAHELQLYRMRSRHAPAVAAEAPAGDYMTAAHPAPGVIVDLRA